MPSQILSFSDLGSTMPILKCKFDATLTIIFTKSYLRKTKGDFK